MNVIIHYNSLKFRYTVLGWGDDDDDAFSQPIWYIHWWYSFRGRYLIFDYILKGKQWRHAAFWESDTYTM